VTGVIGRISDLRPPASDVFSTNLPSVLRGSNLGRPACGNKCGRCQTSDTRPADGHTCCTAAWSASWTLAL